ncbi:F-box domain [Arabidopsis thaliana x Arabidopsis arenosa]|uniref:F-box domain n=1 Tax=Arabidopsis thaliana x Arabidopsis arenosa TaxID=1240361 RepID=A0A8T2B0G2_9BRAS|nr:F-box domain [Arabidopsis thaliana x Arabidopsis arenosa]
MKSKKIHFSSKDIISNLPEALLCHILSFLPIKDSALTSVLSKKWRYLFAFRPNLDFDGLVNNLHHREDGNRERDEINRMFMDFVNRVLGLQGNSIVNKFSLKCGIDVDPVCVISWIVNVLERGVSDLDLRVSVDRGELPSKVFMSESLVRLRIESQNVSAIDVEDVFLPKLKTLYLDTIMLGKAGDYFDKILYGCHVLEELVMINVYSDFRNRSVSSKTLKRLKLSCIEYDQIPDTVSFDTPNLVYLEYSDYVAGKYPRVNFCSLVEACLNLHMTYDQCAQASYGDLVGNATDFLMGVSNVQILHLSDRSLEVLTFCCEPIPVFNSLTHLTIKTHRHGEVGWESLPALLKKCPNLETLVFQGLHHKDTIKCEEVDGCLCKYSEDIPTCLSSSPVKVVKVWKFGEKNYYYNDIKKQIEQVKHFLETMPNLEQMILYYDTPYDDDVLEVSKQLQKLTRVASAKCKIQVISDNLSLSFSFSTSGLTFFNSTFPV